MIKWTMTTTATYTVAAFEIEGGIVEPSELKDIDIPAEIPRDRGLIISGRGPIWLYAHLIHMAHAWAWVATHDPRLGYIVVQRHVATAPKLGEVLPVA